MTATTCDAPGCGGSVVDGYCDTCGTAPQPSSPAATANVDVERLATGTVPSGAASHRSGVGLGVIDIASADPADPSAMIMTDPSVPEGRRFCANTECGQPVGQARGGRPGRPTGFCSSCGSRFDFTPKLGPGDLVADQYQVVGPLAHGGLGWIYLARDRNVSDRWCVLKGLLDTADPAAAEAAVAERRFLAEVQHPAIVEIFNFVNHAGQSYIVMEYLGGPSLKDIAVRRREAGEGPLPVTVAAAYLLSILPAFSYLHQRGLVYCDLKPDNIIHVGDQVQLIDLGAVRRLDDPDAAIFGTYGYQAPEVSETGPSVASDLYTVGRCLPVLTLDWPEWQHADRHRLPSRENHQVLVDHDCLWRFLQRACATDPGQRFADADEMAAALHGVLCQVAAAGDGEPRPYNSNRSSPPRPRVDRLDWRALPRPTLPSHPRLPDRVAGLADGDPAAAITLAASAGELSWADRTALTWAYCDVGELTAARAMATALDPADRDADGYRALIGAARTYLHGVVALASGEADAAAEHFDAAYAAAPGEPACALAFAAALEATGDRNRLEEAATLYHQVALTDPTWVSAVAGLARVLLAVERPDAVLAYTVVPATHPARTEALTHACRAMGGDSLLVGHRERRNTRNGRPPRSARYDSRVADAAADLLQAVPPGNRAAPEAELAVALYGAALAALQHGEAIGGTVAGAAVSGPEIARAAEQALLELADVTPNPGRRRQLLDTAARTRPWSWW